MCFSFLPMKRNNIYLGKRLFSWLTTQKINEYFSNTLLWTILTFSPPSKTCHVYVRWLFCYQSGLEDCTSYPTERPAQAGQWNLTQWDRLGCARVIYGILHTRNNVKSNTWYLIEDVASSNVCQCPEIAQW